MILFYWQLYYLACLIFPMAINTQFSNKYHRGVFEPVPIILNSIGLFEIIMADVYGEMLGLAIIITIVLYAISIFLVSKSAEELGCKNGDTVKMILANALMPVNIILTPLFFLYLQL